MTILTKKHEFYNVDWTIAAGGDARDGDTAVSLSGVTGDIKFAFLYWGELSFYGSSDNTITINGSSVSGDRLGTSVDTCWGSDHSIGYFADVTDHVTDNGTYSIDGMGVGGQGATLIVFYDDEDLKNNRDVTLFSGNDATNSSGQITTISLGNIEYESGDVNLILSVGDGQSFEDGALAVNGTNVGSNLFPGSNGSLWDVVEVDITSQLSEGDNRVRLTHESVSDCLQFINVVVDTPATSPILFLDFNNKIPVDFHTKQAGFFGFGNKQVVGERSGTEPLGQFTDSQQAQLVQLVQDIFDRSGIAMEVTSTKPPNNNDFHSVRFSSDKLSYDGDGDGLASNRLLGRAYEGIDQYNKDDNDIVAVFMDGSDPLLVVAETVVHEAAHAFGARHLNPTQGSGSEVMDYDSSGLETFIDTPANITEPPLDGNSSISTTHNPTYHIRRYVGGESHEQLRLENIEPGTWDRGFFNKIFYSIGIVDLEGSLTSISLLTPGFSDSVDGDVTEGLGALTLISDNISEGQEISFSIPEGTAFKIVASSEDDTVIDVVMEFDPSADDPFTMTASQIGTISGSFVSGETEDQFSRFGSFSLAVTDVEEIRSESELPTLALSVDKDAISEFLGTAVITISRGEETDGDLEIILASNDTSEALVPNDVIIPDGQSEVEVVLHAQDDYLSDGTQIATITALAEGYNNGVATINVLDNETYINSPPVAIDDAFSVNEDQALAGNVLDDNGNGADSDPDGDALTVSLVSGPAEGVLTLNDDGSFSYEADADTFDLAAPGDVIEQRFTYQIDDGNGEVDQANATISVITLGDGETFVGGNGRETLIGTDGGEDLLIGENGDDELYGLDGADTLEGGRGDDLLFGGEGPDFLFGGQGNDLLNGGLGDDELTGGKGDDIFVFTLGEGTDTILDYRIGEDLIGLEGLRFGDLSIGQAGDDATISSNGELLAVMVGVDSSTLTEPEFILA